MDIRKTKTELQKLVKAHPKAFIVLAIFFGVSLLLLLTDGSPEQTVAPISPKQEKPQIISVQDNVDPRDVWANELGGRLNELNELTEQVSKSLAAQQDSTLATIASLKAEIEELKARPQITAAPPEIKAMEPPSPIVQAPKPQANFVHLSRPSAKTERKDTENYITSGAFARAVLLGVVAETGTESQGSPQPILLRLVDSGIFSKGYRTKQILDAIIIGSCYGNISSERAVCRLESLSLKNREGDIVERPVEGWLIGEDGRPGIKGDVVDKASDVTRMAVLNGILGGMAGFMQNQATSSIYPISPLTGVSNAIKGETALKAGAASGVGNALQKLADYAIKRAEQMSPIIIVGAGRTIDVVFKKGFQLKDVVPIDNNPQSRITSVGNANNQTRQKPSRDGGYNQGVGALNDLQIHKGDF